MYHYVGCTLIYGPIVLSLCLTAVLLILGGKEVKLTITQNIIGDVHQFIVHRLIPLET